ncbi:MAG TPA: phosphoglycerate kinase [Candidatus Bathyarchaeia archaeon]|nr:phosphoglycerate kinase [Candidatus Bathyarchaeia archaeon]
MEFHYLTLNDFELKDKRILLRLDINSPLDPGTKQILDDSRIVAARPTLDALTEARVVVLSHQSRPGKDDFTSLQQHADLLQKACSQRVKFVDDVMGPAARDAIKEVKRGEVLVLDNVRLCAEENLEEKGEKLAKTNLVSRLAPLFNLYVNDAFATSHRSQASLVGFPWVLPSAAGKLMEKELSALNKLLKQPEQPSTYVLGGAKIEDKVPVIENILATGKADNVLVGGNVGKVFLKALGQKFNNTEEEKLSQATSQVQKATEILRKFAKRIILPTDFGVLANGKRTNVDAKKLARTGEALDIGAETGEKFAAIINKSRTVVASGPLGVFEQEGFEIGTKILLETMGNADAFTVIGGGHLAGYAGILGIDNRFSHVSTAGGAMLALLAGEELPAITALVDASKRHGKMQHGS